ncbi:MAG: hypothetical protein KDE64_11130 [Rhodocyclaceae bacterium]|nr:hypothetical protein [Rhodocyclaceae bacterium]
MAFYGPSIFYPFAGANQGKIVRLAAKSVRQPVVWVDDESLFDCSDDGPLADSVFPVEKVVILLDDREHVLTIRPEASSIQFSENYNDIAIECALNGWMVVKI